MGKSVEKIRVIIVHTASGNTFGDRIRIGKVQDSLINAGFEVFSLRLPIVQRNDLLVPANLKSLLLGTISLNNFFQIRSRVPFQNPIDLAIISTSLEYLRREVKRIRPTFIISETATAGLAVSIVSREFAIPCIVDMHGLAFAEALGSKKGNWKLILRMEIEALKNCTYVVVVSRKMREYVTQKMGVPNTKIIVASNGAEPQKVHADYARPLKVIFAGGFAYWEKVQDFIEIAKQANPQKFKFFLAGDGPLRIELLEKIKKDNIPVTYLGRIPKQRIFSILSKAQVGIAPSTWDLTRQVASPIKIFDYLAAGLPVITPRIGDCGDLINDEDCGFALNDESTGKYIEALNLLADKNTWIRKSKNAIKVTKEKYSWNKTLQPLTNFLLNVTK
jgi:glycosyltransferase involved in cell wall biosynthesis